MKHPVQLLLLFSSAVVLLALHYGVISINLAALSRIVWVGIQWATGILGGFIITSCLEDINKSDSS